ncbi:MAG: GspH/FimT family pseudopilin [Gallionella sp.]
MSGFSLVELMITIVIFSIATSYGVSSFRTWTQNTQIRNAAESIQNGLMRARAEAVKRNTAVAFVLGANSSWKVDVVGGVQVDARGSNEGSRNVTATVAPSGATTVTYNSFGLVINNAMVGGAIPPTITAIDLNSSVLDSARSLKIELSSPGGNVRMCDPNLAKGNPQACYP